MPVILQIKGSDSLFNPIFEDWEKEEELCKAWQVCTKVKDSIENGNRMENLSWRLWYLHRNMVRNKNISSKDFKKITAAKKHKLQKLEPENEKVFQNIKNYIENQKKNKNKSKNDVKQEQIDKDLKSKVKIEATSTPIYNNNINNLDNITPSYSLNESMLSNMDIMKVKSHGSNGIDTLDLSLNKSFNQNPDLLFPTDTPTNDDYSNITDLFNQFPNNQANIPAPQPPSLHIPDQSIRTEISEICLNNKLGKLNDINTLYDNLYDDGINNDDPAFNNIFNKLNSLSPAITHHSSFTNNSFPNLTPHPFNSSADSLNNSLSFSSTIPDDNVSISLINHLSPYNGINSSNISSFSDLTNTSNLASINNFTNTSSDLLGLNNMTGSSALGVLNDVHNPAAISLDNTNDFTTSILNNPSLLTTSLQQSLSTTNSNSLSNTIVDTTNAKKATITSASPNDSKTNLTNNSILSAIQGKTDANGIFPISTTNTSSIVTSQNKANSLPLNIFNNASDSMVIPVTSLANNSIPTASALTLTDATNVSVNGNSMALNVNGLDLTNINNQLLMKNMIKSPLPQNITTSKINSTTTINDSSHLNNAKLSNDLVVPYDIQATVNTTDALKSTKDNATPSVKTSALNDNVKIKQQKKEINTTVTNKNLNNNTNEKTNGVSNQEILFRYLLSQNSNLSREQLAMYAEQFSKISTKNTSTKNTSDQIKNQNTTPTIVNSNPIPSFDKNPKTTNEEINRIMETIKTTQANLLLNQTTNASLLSSLITNPIYKNISTTVTNGKVPIRADGPSTPKIVPPISDNKILPKNQKNDKTTKGKAKKVNSTASSATVTPVSAKPSITTAPSSTILQSLSTPDNLSSLQKTPVATPTSSQSQPQPQLQTQSQPQAQQLQQQKSTTTKKKTASLYINQKTAAIDSMAQQHVKPVCANCGVNHTPLWRRSANDEILCNACGLYQKLHKVPRPKSIRQHAVRKDTQAMTEHETTECSNCHTTNTPLWRRDENGATLCNACGLYQKMHHSARPISMKTDLPRKRQRFDPMPNIPGMVSPNLLTSPGIGSFLPYGNFSYPMGFGGLPGGSQFLYNPLTQPTLSPALSDKSDKSSKSKKKQKTSQTSIPQKKIKLSNPSPTVQKKKK